MAVEVFDNGGDLDSVFGYSLRQDCLVGKVSNKRRALLVEDKTGWLSTS